MPDKKLSEVELERGRVHARLTIIGSVGKFLEQLMADGTLNQSRLADRLGVSRQAVSRLLSGPGDKNWTTDKIGEVLAAAGARITQIEVKSALELKASSDRHDWLEPSSLKVIDVSVSLENHQVAKIETAKDRKFESNATSNREAVYTYNLTAKGSKSFKSRGEV